MSTNWLITGGCGFIGTSLIPKLQNEGVRNIRVVDDLSVGTEADLAGVCTYSLIERGEISVAPDGIELVVGDILDAGLALSASKGIDVIVHLAANTGVPASVENPRLDCMMNVLGTFNYLEAARMNSVPKFVFASSGAPAGNVDPPIHEEMPAHPVSPYGASKLAGEGYCSSYYHTYGVETVSLRFGNVYGPGSKHKSSVVAKFIRLAMNGEPLEIYGEGNQTRDFIYIDDLIEAVYLAATVPDVGGQIFQIASNKETTVGEMTEMLLMELENHGVEGVRVINGATRLGDVKRNYSDTSKAKRILGWKSRTTLDEGIRRTISYFSNMV